MKALKFFLPATVCLSALVTTLSQHLDPMSALTLSAAGAYTAWSLLGWAEKG